MNNKQILIVEDEEHLLEALKLNFELEGYAVTGAKDGKIALDKAKKEYFDLIILDVMLPEVDGFTVAETLRVQQNNTPILMLSAKGSTEDKITGLKKGADDYLTKPFNLEELLIRAKKLIDKNEKITISNAVNDVYLFGSNTINFKTLEAKGINQQRFLLSKKEIMLLKLLIENENIVVAREKILQTVWNYQVYPTTRTIDNFILNFRKYFEVDSRNPKHFHSIRGIGYKFISKKLT